MLGMQSVSRSSYKNLKMWCLLPSSLFYAHTQMLMIQSDVYKCEPSMF